MSPRKHVPLCSLRGRSPRRLLRAAVTTALVAAGVAALGQQPAAAAVQYTFYASPTGSGSTCSLAAPCSLTGARDKVRTVNAAMTGDIVVDLRGGTYALTSTFALTANGTVDDSGFNGHDVIYQAYPGETPVLSGGTTITGTWTLTNPTLNIYSIPVPSTLDTLQLYVNGQAATLARGEYLPTGVSYTPGTGAVTISNPAYTGMASWRNPTRILMSSKASYKYLECPIASYSTSGSNTLAHLAQPCGYNVDASLNPAVAFSFGLVDRVENAYELLDTAGEWYLDKAASTLDYIPLPGQNMATATVIAPSLETLMTGTGDITHPLHDIQISGITFAYATWLRALSNQGYAAIQGGLVYDTPSGGSLGVIRSHGNIIFTKTEHVVISGNTFRHLGGVGLQFQTGPQHNTIVGNVFDDIAASAITMGEFVEPGVDNSPTVDVRLKTYDNLIKDNYVSRSGAQYLDAVAIYDGYSDGTSITHNEIRNVPYDGIQIGAYGGGAASYQQHNDISYNVVDGVMSEMQDGGAIYTAGTQPNSTMVGNVTAHVNNQYGSNCLYLDAATRGYTVDSNVLQDCQHWAVIQVAPAADHNTVVSNNFYTPGSQLVYDASDTTNTYSNNAALTNPFQSGAQTIVAGAGLEPAYASITWCASDGNTCSFDGTRVVSYGSGTTFVQGRFTGSVLCSSSVFGDPTPGVAKHCQFGDQDIPQRTGIWTSCAGGVVATCAFSGTKTVAFGATGIYRYATATGSLPCQPSSFNGDPRVNVFKRCYVLATAQFADPVPSVANWTVNTGTWATGGGAYTESATGTNTDSVITGRTWADSVVEFDAVLGTSGAGSSGWIGVQIRKSASNHNFAQSGYLVYLTASGVVGLFKPGALLRSAQTDYSFTAPTHVRIVAQGSYLAVYLNFSPVPVFDAYDTSYTSGYTSLATSWASGSFADVSSFAQ